MWAYILTYVALSLSVLGAPIALFCLSGLAFLQGVRISSMKSLALMNGLLLFIIAAIVAVVGNETVMASAIFGYIVVGILLVIVTAVTGAFWLANRTYLLVISLQMKWQRQ